MAEVHIVDIDGEQWDIKDLPLTERVANLETDVSTNTEQINSIKNEMYYLKRKEFLSNRNEILYLKIENLFPNETRRNNIFVVTERNGGYGLLSVGIGDYASSRYVSYIRVVPGAMKINSIIFSENDVYFEMATYWFVGITQIAGKACDISGSIQDVAPSGTQVDIKSLVFN